MAPTDAGATGQKTLSPAELFAFADAARDRGEYDVAEAAYRALCGNPDPDLRNEASFRLAMMLADKLHRYREAAVELRSILDERPHTQRVRLELARVQAAMGHLGAAERELRAAEADGALPPEVQRNVRFFANTFHANRRMGGSLQAAIAPDSNINRSTRSDSLNTIVGDFTLGGDAREQSGVGAALRGQAYWLPLDLGPARSGLRLAASADLYGKSRFDDISLALQASVEAPLGSDRFNLNIGPIWRWYGLKPYTSGWSASGRWQHPTNRRTQIYVEGAVTRIDNHRSIIFDSTGLSLAFGAERAISAQTGIGGQVYAQRQTARDRAYATAGGGLSGFIYRELGRTTVVASAGYGHLEADARLAALPRRRRDDRWNTALGATFRSMRVGTFAPMFKLGFERNRSTVELYDYRRVSAEVGLVGAF